MIQPGGGVGHIHLTRAHLLHAHPAHRTRVCTHVPTGRLGWVCASRQSRTDRARPVSAVLPHARVPPHAPGTAVLARCFRGTAETREYGHA